MNKKSWRGIVALCALLVLVLAGCGNTATVEQTPNPSASLTDQVKQALSSWAVPEQRTVEEVSPGFIVVTLVARGDPAGEAETLATATNIASGYQKSIWQADLTDVQEVTVIIIQTNYLGGTANASRQDVVKAIVAQATGTTLDWNSGTPAEQFRRFDVHWVITDGIQEP